MWCCFKAKGINLNKYHLEEHEVIKSDEISQAIGCGIEVPGILGVDSL